MQNAISFNCFKAWECNLEAQWPIRACFSSIIAKLSWKIYGWESTCIENSRGREIYRDKEKETELIRDREVEKEDCWEEVKKRECEWVVQERIDVV